MSDDIWIQCDNCGRILKDAMRETSAEIATLKRRLELVIKNRAEMEDCWNCPVYDGSETLTCRTLENCEERITRWSLEQAKKGGGG